MNNITVLLVHLGDFERILAIANKIVVGLYIASNGCQFAAGESGKGVPKKSVDSNRGKVQDDGDDNVFPRRSSVEKRHCAGRLHSL